MNREKWQIQSFKQHNHCSSLCSVEVPHFETVTTFHRLKGIITEEFQLSFKPLTPQSSLDKNHVWPKSAQILQGDVVFLGYFLLLHTHLVSSSALRGKTDVNCLWQQRSGENICPSCLLSRVHSLCQRRKSKTKRGTESRGWEESVKTYKLRRRVKKYEWKVNQKTGKNEALEKESEGNWKYRR